MAWLILDKPTYAENLETFTALEAMACQVMGYPNDIGTERYSFPCDHPDGVQIAFPVQGSIESEYYGNPDIKMFVDSLVADAPSKLVQALPEGWIIDKGDS